MLLPYRQGWMPQEKNVYCALKGYFQRSLGEKSISKRWSDKLLFFLFSSFCSVFWSFFNISYPEAVLHRKQPSRKRCSENIKQIYGTESKQLCNFIEITFLHGWSPVNLLYIFRKPFYKNTYGWLLLHFD